MKLTDDIIYKESKKQTISCISRSQEMEMKANRYEDNFVRGAIFARNFLKKENKMLKLKIKKLYDDVKLPIQATEKSGCYDIFAYSDPIDNGIYLEYETGLSIEPPDGYDVIILPRSSISKTGLMLANSVGYVDNDFRGELMFRFKYMGPSTDIYQKGDRIGQMRLIEKNEFYLDEVDIISDTDRGEGGFGSTGK